MYHSSPSSHSVRKFPPAASSVPNSSTPSRKRKADLDGHDSEGPSSYSPASHGSRSDPLTSVSSNRITKRARPNRQPRKLNLSRILESLDADALRNVIESICVSHPNVHHELLQSAPRPSAEECMKLLSKYETEFRNAFPFGGRESSDYSFNRVHPHLIALLEALKDYTPSFLPPVETQTSVSLAFLDGVTSIVHRIPQWDSFDNNRHKDDAYDDLSEAWATVVREAAKRGGGFHFINAGWDAKLVKHNETSGGKLEAALQEMRTQLTWLGNEPSCGPAALWKSESDASASIRQQLFKNRYAHGTAVQVGPW